MHHQVDHHHLKTSPRMLHKTTTTSSTARMPVWLLPGVSLLLLTLALTTTTTHAHPLRRALLSSASPSCSLAHTAKPPTSPLVFLHLPKVGGTSIHTFLSQVSAERNLSMCDHLTLPHVIMNGHSYQPVIGCNIVFGHLFYGLTHGYTEHIKPTYSVILRDPIERVLSLYYYVLKYPEHYQVCMYNCTSL